MYKRNNLPSSIIHMGGRDHEVKAHGVGATIAVRITHGAVTVTIVGGEEEV